MGVKIEYEIYQGDTGPLLRVRPSVLAEGEVIGAGWHCYIAARTGDNQYAIPVREVTDKSSDNLRWLVALLPSETETLDPDTEYDMVIEVVNDTTTPPFTVEKHYPLKVLAQGVTH